MTEPGPQEAVEIRPFAAGDAAGVEALFIRVNRLLAPDGLEERFEAYITASIADEIGRIEDYYADRGGRFWVATDGGRILGMFGLERHGDDGMELRRMYVAPEARRRGLARRMLALAEDYCREAGIGAMHLSTAEIQKAAIGLYQACGYELIGEEVAREANNKTVGGDMRRFHFVKALMS